MIGFLVAAVACQQSSDFLLASRSQVRLSLGVVVLQPLEDRAAAGGAAQVCGGRVFHIEKGLLTAGLSCFPAWTYQAPSPPYGCGSTLMGLVHHPF